MPLYPLIALRKRKGHPYKRLRHRPKPALSLCPMRITSPLDVSESLPIPTFTQSSPTELGLQSTLADLPRCTFAIPDTSALQAVMERFIQFPELPGVLITGTGGDRLLSRQQLLECLLHTGQVSQSESIRQLLHIANRKALTLPLSTSILKAAKEALRRSLEMQNVPILVQQAEGSHQLLDSRILNLAHWQIRGIETQFRYERLQMQLLQSEKMAALGRLVDGVAHEILDPVGFIWGNLSHIDSYVQQQSKLLAAYEAALPTPPQPIAQIAADIELDYLRSDLPAAIKSAQGGAHRLKQLATSLQNYCHIDDIHPRPTDINALIDSTIHLLKSRIASPIAIDCNYGKLPPIPCYAGQLSQVFMTLLTHAADSLLACSFQSSNLLAQTVAGGDQPASYQRDSKPPTIEIVTCVCNEQARPQITQSANSQPIETRWVSITVRDNGLGLSPSRKAQILNSFSTKSRSRKESGLALSYQIVTAKHGGRFWLQSPCKSVSTAPKNASYKGTEFEILLPLSTASVS